MALARLQELEEEMLKCFRCNLCKMIPLPAVRNPDYFDGCPANREFGFHSHSGSGKQIMALALVQGRLQADRAMAAAANACTACGSCDVSCKFIMDAERHQVNLALREHLVDEGQALPVHAEIVRNLSAHGHPNGKPPVAPGQWAAGLGLKEMPRQSAAVLLFAGCLQAEDPGSARVARRLARLLVRAGVDVGILGDSESSCGLAAYWTGHRDAFREIAGRTTALLDGLGVKTIVTASGSCLGAFRSKYPEYAKAPAARTVHATEFLWELIRQKRLRLPRPIRRRVTYHDPCYLGRQSEPPVAWTGETRLARGCMTYNVPPRPINRGGHGVYDAPRNILGAIPGLDFVEMYRIREYAFCCGGGGGVPEAYPALARSTALHRLAEARAVGAGELVTACHRCRIQFGKAIDPPGGGAPDLAVADIIDLVHEAAGLEAEEAR